MVILLLRQNLFLLLFYQSFSHNIFAKLNIWFSLARILDDMRVSKTAIEVVEFGFSMEKLINHTMEGFACLLRIQIGFDVIANPQKEIPTKTTFLFL